jgi:rubrerythrin
MHDKNYNEYNLDNKNEPKKKLSKETHKKRNKHWRNNSKHNKSERTHDLNMDSELLRMQNLIICKSCNNVYHNSLEKCPHC